MGLRWYEQTQADIPAGESWLNEWERTHVSRLRIPKRRADWVLGRWTAKRAVASYLCFPESLDELARIEIWPLPSGAPRLFVDRCVTGMNVSLSHCRGIAVCLVGEAWEIFGCDIEAIETRTAAFVSDYFDRAERAAIQAAAGPERDRLITLMWSAKESALKALCAGLRVDTRCLSVEVGEGVSTGENGVVPGPSIASLVWQPLRVRYGDGQTFAGAWCSDETTVRTFVSSESVGEARTAAIPAVLVS